jgi:hypothetical protein
MRPLGESAREQGPTTDCGSNLHTNLNRLITSRLPLALPPQAADASLYATGLLHFAHIFLTFESLWADLLRDDPAATSNGSSPLLSYLLVNPYDAPSLFTNTLGAPTRPSPRLAAFLQTLRPRGLMRSPRLKRDLEHLLGLDRTDLEVVLATYPGDKVAEFCAHIRQAVHEKPWTLVSYAWCFYMAVFSGGRWIRGGLLNAGPVFWRARDDDSSALATRGLSLWHFPGLADGEDIKADFKARLAAAETLFTPDERVDIIEEAKHIFSLCATLIEELDGMLGTDLTGPPDVKKESTTLHAEAGASYWNLSALHGKSNGALAAFVRRPKVIGTLVVVACLMCVALLRLQ